jgi:beta-lactamase class D
MKLKLLFVPILLAPLSCFADICKTTTDINIDPYVAEIGTRKVTFLAVNLSTNSCSAINQAGLTERHGPYSTFKIPHTLIALETGAVQSMDERFEWNQKKHPAKSFWPETWKQSHTLASAFQHSAVWYYKELVPRIKPADYKTWLARFSYGNQQFTPGSNEFWLNNELTISPLEQVEFLACLLKDGCGVSAKNIAAFEAAAIQEGDTTYSLYTKTGAGSIDPDDNDGAFNGWYVGYVKNAEGKPVTAFALYMEADSFSALKNYRKELSLQLLKDLKFM